MPPSQIPLVSSFGNSLASFFCRRRRLYQAPITIINRAYHEDAFAYWAARLMVAFSVARNLISSDEADAWLMSLSQMQDADRFFFSATPILTIATAITPERRGCIDDRFGTRPTKLKLSKSSPLTPIATFEPKSISVAEGHEPTSRR